MFRECFVLGIIDNETTFELLNIAEARNATTHDYDLETAKETYERIADYCKILKRLKKID